MRALPSSVLLVMAVMVPACESKPSTQTSRASWSAAGTLWAEQMAKALPEPFCRDTMYFRTCFKISEQDCRTMTTAQIEACLDRHPDIVPKDVNRQTGQAAGNRLGTCAGEGLESALRRQGKFTGAAHCNDLEYWRREAQKIEQGFK